MFECDECKRMQNAELETTEGNLSKNAVYLLMEHLKKKMHWHYDESNDCHYCNDCWNKLAEECKKDKEEYDITDKILKANPINAFLIG